jgi:hypothetical protein
MESIETNLEDAEAPYEIVDEVVQAIQHCNELFEKGGGTTRHYVRDCLLPYLQSKGITVGITTNKTT